MPTYIPRAVKPRCEKACSPAQAYAAAHRSGQTACSRWKGGGAGLFGGSKRSQRAPARAAFPLDVPMRSAWRSCVARRAESEIRGSAFPRLLLLLLSFRSAVQSEAWARALTTAALCSVGLASGFQSADERRADRRSLRGSLDLPSHRRPLDQAVLPTSSCCFADAFEQLLDESSPSHPSSGIGDASVDPQA